MDESDDPVTIALVAGASFQAYGQYQSGKAAEAQGKAEQQIAEYNTTLKERQADAERERARVEAERFSKEGDALQATQNVQFAKGGVLVTEGTPALVLEQTAMELEANRMAILTEGFLAGSFLESEAEGLKLVGSAAAAKGKNLNTASQYSAIGSLLSGFGSAYYAGSGSNDAKLFAKHMGT